MNLMLCTLPREIDITVFIASLLVVCINSFKLVNPALEGTTEVPSSSILFTETTFEVCDKSPEKVVPQNLSHLTATGNGESNPSHKLVTYFKEYNLNNCTGVVQESNFGPDSNQIEPTGQHGFTSTVMQAYGRHHNLVIRPDDIWMAIISQFALYIHGNAEKFRDRFVNFKGKQNLVAQMGPGTLETADQKEFVELMTEEIHKNIVDKEVRDWITPNFTTTTRDDEVAAGIVLMASFKKYFEYIQNFACGIPKITLEGTVDDWENIAARLAKLRSYELEWWVDEMLQPILKQFIRAKSGKVDEEFWNQIAMRYGCGGDRVTAVDGGGHGGRILGFKFTGTRLQISTHIRH